MNDDVRAKNMTNHSIVSRGISSWLLRSFMKSSDARCVLMKKLFHASPVGEMGQSFIGGSINPFM